MKISRRGSIANQGTKEINFSNPRFQWSKEDNLLKIHQEGVKDFNSDTAHNYIVSINSNEIAKILRVLADSTMKDPAAFPQELSNSLRSLTQLTALAAGVINP